MQALERRKEAENWQPEEREEEINKAVPGGRRKLGVGLRRQAVPAAASAGRNLPLIERYTRKLYRGTNRTLRVSISVPQLVFLPSAAIVGSAGSFSPCCTTNAS